MPIAIPRHWRGSHEVPAATCFCSDFGHTHVPWDRAIEGVRFINTGSVGKPKDGDPRAGWVLLTVDDDGHVSSDLRRVSYDIATMATAIRAADGLPNAFAADIESGGHP